MMIENRCNDSIRKLITSKSGSVGDSESVEMRFYRMTQLKSISYNVGKVNSYTYDRELKQDVNVEAQVTKTHVSLPLTLIKTSPKGFDLSKASSSPITFRIPLREEKMSQVVDEILKDDALPINNNNFVDAHLLGNAVYSWSDGTMRGAKSLTTESNLSEGSYELVSYMVTVVFTNYFYIDPKGVGRNLFSPQSELIDVDININPEPYGNYHLSVVRKKLSSSKQTKKSKKTEDPTIEEREIEHEIEL